MERALRHGGKIMRRRNTHRGDFIWADNARLALAVCTICVPGAERWLRPLARCG
jgi:hypothetical protein